MARRWATPAIVAAMPAWPTVSDTGWPSRPAACAEHELGSRTGTEWRSAMYPPTVSSSASTTVARVTRLTVRRVGRLLSTHQKLPAVPGREARLAGPGLVRSGALPYDLMSSFPE